MLKERASLRVALVLPLVGFLTVLSGGTAHAACPTSEFCAWTATNGGGTRTDWLNADTAWPSNISNNDETHENHGTSHPDTWVLRSYTATGYAGMVISCLPNDPNWGGYNAQFLPSPDNDGNSHRWESTACSNPGG